MPFISGYVFTLAGSGRKATEDGSGVDASFNNPMGITVNEHTGDIYVSELDGNVIRKISPQGIQNSNKLVLIIFNNI